MKTGLRAVIALAVSLAAFVRPAEAAELCGNGVDDDADGLADEGCYPGLTTGVCESPLSCQETGMVSPLLGGLRYQLPADLAPRVPYGPGIGLRRFYTSLYEPGSGAPAWKTPLGDRWQHTYMTWLAKTGSAPSSTIVLHTNRGQDIRATYASSSGGWDTYTPQTGFHVQYLRQRQAAPYEYQLRMLTGETLVYNTSGQLTEIWDTLATPNKVLVAYDGAGQVSTVTDASGKRRLVFGYGGGKLTSVQFQVQLAGVFTTYHTTSYGYTAGKLATVTLGGQLAQTNVYASNYLTQIQDGGGKTIVGFTYNATPGMVARIDATSGNLGYDYSSSRAACTGKTVLYFNLGNATSCDVDADCGSGYLCGGKTGAGATGRCFRGARCLTVTSPSEDVVTTVTALGPPGESCEGACLEASQYVWNTGSGVLDLAAIQDPSGNYTVRAFNAHGLPTTISVGDPDTDPANGNGARTTFLWYDATFPGKIAEVRRQSDLAPDKTCSATSEQACARTLYSYSADGKLTRVDELGYTLNSSNGVTSYAYTTFNAYDTKGRLTQIDGPLAGSDDVTVFTYHSPVGGLADDFLEQYNRKKDASTFLTQKAVAYDFRGNPTQLVDADGTVTCLTFDAARGHLVQRREAMAGQSDCSANAADLVTSWTRDGAQRLTQITRPDGSCLFYEYDAKGRLARTKRRDDCNPSSAGDRQEYVYDAEGLITEIQTYDAASTLTAKQPFTYFDSRRLARVVNPVDVATWTGIQYDTRGLVQQIDGAGGLGKTVFNRTGLPGAEGRVTSVAKYKTSTTFDTWNLLYAWLGEQTAVTDGDAKTTETVRDDLGRTVRVVSPDMDGPRLQLYDAASRITLAADAYGVSTRWHAFTYDHLGRPLTSDYAIGGADEGTCFGSTNPPEIEIVYDAPPGTCPIGGSGCTRTAGRVAYEKVRLMCKSGLGTDYSLDQETFYAYDDAGRVIVEYIRDDAGRVAQQSFTWTKNGALAEVVTPSGTSLQWSYGSAGHNSDADVVTAQSHNGTGNPVTSAIQWYPYGPLRQYDQQSTLGGVPTRTRITRNLAYRPTGLYVETQGGGTTLQSTVLAEDAKGRITMRDYTPNTYIQDSYFRYDDQDRLLCETTNFVTSCPTSGTNIRHSFVSSPPFTNAGDWLDFERFIPGSTGTRHQVNRFGYGTSHRVTSLCQLYGTPALGCTNYGYNARGQRTSEDNYGMSYDVRTHAYDQRNNKRQTVGWYRNRFGNWYTYSSISAYDAKNRRVYKSYTANSSLTSTWFMYYDPLDRLTEVTYTPNTADPGTYQVFQLLWLGDRLTAYVQLDVPSGFVSKRYVVTDETNRPIEMWNWPASGDTARYWYANPNAWGFDTTAAPGYFQPVLFAGQFQDPETRAVQDNGSFYRAALAHNGFRTYDPFIGGYLQVDPLADQTWSSYVYANSNPVRSPEWQSRDLLGGYGDPLSQDPQSTIVLLKCKEMETRRWPSTHVLAPFYFQGLSVDDSSGESEVLESAEIWPGLAWAESLQIFHEPQMTPIPHDLPVVIGYERQPLAPTLVSVSCVKDCNCEERCMVTSGPYAGRYLSKTPATQALPPTIAPCSRP